MKRYWCVHTWAENLVNETLGCFWETQHFVCVYMKTQKLNIPRWPYVAPDMYPSDLNKVVISWWCFSVYVYIMGGHQHQHRKTPISVHWFLYFFPHTILYISHHTITPNLIKITSISRLENEKKNIGQNWHVEFLKKWRKKW